MSEIMRAHRWGTNARMIAEAVVPLGYIEGDVFDATYGSKGGFWKEHRPEDLTTNDLNAPADFHEDFTAFSFDDRAACTVVYDPPYKLSGTPKMGEFDQRFGTGVKMTGAQKLAMIHAGAVECWRITGRWLLVKCQDQVLGGKVRWVARTVTNELEARGAQLVDEFKFLMTPIPQPPRRCPDCRGVVTADRVAPCALCDGAGRVPCRQEHARSNYSTLLVFRKAAA